MHASHFIVLSIAALLSAYLVFRQCRQKPPHHPTLPDDGHGIDVTHLKERVEQVRTEFAATVHFRTRNACRRRRLLATARRNAGRLSFLRIRVQPISHQSVHETDNPTG